MVGHSDIQRDCVELLKSAATGLTVHVYIAQKRPQQLQLGTASKAGEALMDVPKKAHNA